jgi:hypothetical protein
VKNKWVRNRKAIATLIALGEVKPQDEVKVLRLARGDDTDIPEKGVYGNIDGLPAGPGPYTGRPYFVVWASTRTWSEDEYVNNPGSHSAWVRPEQIVAWRRATT